MRYVIFGGTGTLGNAVARRLEGSDVTIISRCELKQKQMKEKYPGFKYVLGDVRVPDRYRWPDKGDVVMNFAAQKHVDVAEENPLYAMRVNFDGAVNTAHYAEQIGAAYHVFTSTDKAVLPINFYGATKLAAEKYLLWRNSMGKTFNSVYRWGNVLGSRGSVLQSFVNSLETKQKAYITDKRMTRFWAHMDDIAGYLLDTFETASPDEAMVPPMKASSVLALIDALAMHLKIQPYKVEETGIRPGEKIHECLHTSHDHCIRSDTAEHYTKPELLDLIGRALA